MNYILILKISPTFGFAQRRLRSNQGGDINKNITTIAIKCLLNALDIKIILAQNQKFTK